jgi:hypothetical protein
MVEMDLNDRICAVCGSPVREGKGIVFSHWKLVVHKGMCSCIAEDAMKDRSKSKRGRHRSRGQFLRALKNAEVEE